MTVHPERSLHPIRVLHVLACVGLAFGFAGYAWRHHPVRRVMSAQASRTPTARRAPHGVPFFAGDLAGRLDLVQAVPPDLVGGLGVLLLLSLGTGIYVRRFEVWLEAHQAGEAAAIRGVGLDQAALGANKDRKKGATL